MLMGIAIALFILVSVFLILLILIQKGRGGGLASAFGGAGGNTAFGSKTGDVLTWATSIVFGIFLLLSVTLNLLARSQTADQSAEAPGVVTPQVPPPDGTTPAVPVESGAEFLGGGTPPDQPTRATTQPQ
ncbi:MAG TPA: preprotein translocase subunit SecG [Tepidisphaeraceae bacterium]|nr:preprotein translocase subunit SecG [Tepidisphaeraceae bacterium]